jgi:hypothetical protein
VPRPHSQPGVFVHFIQTRAMCRTAREQVCASLFALPYPPTSCASVQCGHARTRVKFMHEWSWSNLVSAALSRQLPSPQQGAFSLGCMLSLFVSCMYMEVHCMFVREMHAREGRLLGPVAALQPHSTEWPSVPLSHSRARLSPEEMSLALSLSRMRREGCVGGVRDALVSIYCTCMHTRRMRCEELVTQSDRRVHGTEM